MEELMIKLNQIIAILDKSKKQDVPAAVTIYEKLKILKNALFVDDKGYKNVYAFVFNYITEEYGFCALNPILDEYKTKKNLETCYTFDAMMGTRDGRLLFDKTLDHIIKECCVFDEPKENINF